MYYIRFTVLLLTCALLPPCQLGASILHKRVSRGALSNDGTGEVPISTIIKMERADFECGVGCYKIPYQTLVGELDVSDIVRIDVYFYDFGSLTSEGRHIEDVFEVQKVNCHRHRNIAPSPHSVGNYTFTDYSFYKKRFRIAKITDVALPWLQLHGANDVLHLKIRKHNDSDSSYRFAYSSAYLPSMIIQSKSNGVTRVRRSTSSTARSPACTSQNDKSMCCLQSRRMAASELGELFTLAETPEYLTLHRCAGTCPMVIAQSGLDSWFDNGARKCCRLLEGNPIALRIYTGTETIDTINLQLDATVCGCT